MRRKKFLKADIVNYEGWIYPRVFEPQQFREWLDKRNSSGLSLSIELGMGTGDFLIQMAVDHPDRFFLGVEIKEERVLQAMKKASALDLKNIVFLQAPIQHLIRYEIPQLERIYAFFSDPWPKKRHHKRRLTFPSYLKLYEDLMSPGAELWMKTDHSELFESSLEYLALENWSILEQNERYQTPEQYLSKFERKWLSKGLSVYFIRSRPPEEKVI